MGCIAPQAAAAQPARAQPSRGHEPQGAMGGGRRRASPGTWHLAVGKLCHRLPERAHESHDEPRRRRNCRPSSAPRHEGRGSQGDFGFPWSARVGLVDAASRTSGARGNQPDDTRTVGCQGHVAAPLWRQRYASRSARREGRHAAARGAVDEAARPVVGSARAARPGLSGVQGHDSPYSTRTSGAAAEFCARHATDRRSLGPNPSMAIAGDAALHAADEGLRTICEWRPAKLLCQRDSH